MKAKERECENQDLLKAKTLLIERKLSLCIVKDSKTLFESKRQGIAPFLEVIDTLGGELANASVADKVVGKAVALLCARSGVGSVYADVLSEGAKTLFYEHSIRFESAIVVDNILNTDKKLMCPFELLIERVKDPEEAYKMLVQANQDTSIKLSRVRN